MADDARTADAGGPAAARPDRASTDRAGTDHASTDRASTIRSARGRVAGGWGMTATIAWRNLSHDPIRLAATIVGIVFSVLLMGMQMGLLLYFIHTTAVLVDHAGADIWVSANGVNTVDLSTPLSDRWRYHAKAVPGVARAESYIVDIAAWKRGNGTRESVILVGVDVDATMGQPWSMQDGISAADALAMPDGVIVDRMYAAKLGVSRIGETFEINDRKVRVAGFTYGIRTFTQSPYVFTTLDRARHLAGRDRDHISYVLVAVAPGHAPDKVLADLRDRLVETEVLLAPDLSERSSNYWLLSTGAGMSLIMSGLLGLLVGGVVVAQTLYASTMDRMPQYSTIRAMGGPTSYLVRIVLVQAGLSGVIGYVIGMIGVAGIVFALRDASASPELPPWLGVGIGVITLATCLIASLASLSKINRIDPTRVFR